MLIYDKTDLGRQEISQRSLALPARLRTLLVMVDGKLDAAGLLAKLGVLGVEPADLEDLAQRGLIAARPVAPPLAEPDAAPRPAARLRRGMRPLRPGLRMAAAADNARTDGTGDTESEAHADADADAEIEGRLASGGAALPEASAPA